MQINLDLAIYYFIAVNINNFFILALLKRSSIDLMQY